VKNKSILVIDDNEEFLGFVLDFLINDLNLNEVIWAVSPEDAWKKVKVYNPGIIILDLGMKKLDGQEISTLINTTQASPLILMTSFYENNDYIKLSRELGADGFALKDHFKSALVELMAFLENNNETGFFKDKQHLLN
jgi:two-component system nitrate/nitrite response regulator NarL